MCRVGDPAPDGTPMMQPADYARAFLGHALSAETASRAEAPPDIDQGKAVDQMLAVEMMQSALINCHLVMSTGIAHFLPLVETQIVSAIEAMGIVSAIEAMGEEAV